MKNNRTLCGHFAITYSRVIAVALVGSLLLLAQTQAQTDAQASWRDDQAWYSGKAEWALYDAVRVVYGKPRHYQATIFTNKQHMDLKTTTKASNWQDPDLIEVFKHNVSEIFPTENYPYRMLTTSFIRTDNLQPLKVTASSQEDCGSSFRNFVAQDDQMKVDQFCYFPDTGHSEQTIDISKGIAFHNALSLTLRDFPYGVIFIKQPELNLVPDQRNNAKTKTSPARATITYIGEEEITVPYGKLKAHHLRVDHAEDGGETESHFWFAADAKLLNVMVQYQGPYGINYKLKNYGWWAYWDGNNKKPD